MRIKNNTLESRSQIKCFIHETIILLRSRSKLFIFILELQKCIKWRLAVTKKIIYLQHWIFSYIIVIYITNINSSINSYIFFYFQKKNKYKIFILIPILFISFQKVYILSKHTLQGRKDAFHTEMILNWPLFQFRRKHFKKFTL